MSFFDQVEAYPALGMAWGRKGPPRREVVWGEKEARDFVATYSDHDGLGAIILGLTEHARCYVITHRTYEGYNWLDRPDGYP